MNRAFVIIAVFSIMSLGFTVGSKANSMAQSGFRTYDTAKLIGLTVKARDGIELGRIIDLVIDSRDRVDFAIVNMPSFEEFPGKLVVVPFSMLTISKAQPDKMSVVFNANKEKFYEGPDWGYENLSNPKDVASVDRYYGIQPYWTEAGHNRTPNPYRWGGEAQDF